MTCRATRFAWKQCAGKALRSYRDVCSDIGLRAPAEAPLLQEV